MVLEFGKIASFNGHGDIPWHEATYVRAVERERNNFSGREEDSQRVFYKFRILLIARDKMQQFAGSCDYYQRQQFNRCGSTVAAFTRISLSSVD